MFTRARKVFSWLLVASLFAITVLVPSTSQAAYKKRVLPSACEGATVEHFWKDKTYKFVSSSDGQDLFFTAMGALDPYTGGEYEVARAKWASLCDPQRKAYLVWMESVVRVGLYLNYDYVKGFDGPSVFGGSSYPDGDGSRIETKLPMDIEEIGTLFQEEPRIFDIVAVGRPGTPHSGSTLGGFTSEVCKQTEVGCPKKATPAKASSGGSTGSAPAATGSSGSSGSAQPARAATPACQDDKGQPKPCPPPADDQPAP